MIDFDSLPQLCNKIQQSANLRSVFAIKIKILTIAIEHQS